MIKDKNTLKQEILDIKNGNVVEGLKIGIPEIDEFYRFQKNGSLDIFVGHANVGKTTFIMYLMTLFAKKHGLKFAVWSAENTSSSIMRKNY
jgi:replicative DNA helicase